MTDIDIGHHYRIFREVFWSAKFTGSSITYIKRRVDQLVTYKLGSLENLSESEKRGYENIVKELAFSELWIEYITRQHFLKFDVNKGGLSTFIVTYIHNNMNNLLRRHEPRKIINEMRCFNDENDEEKLDYGWIRKKVAKDPLDPRNNNYLVCFEEIQGYTPFASNIPTPEEEIFGKELEGIVARYLSETDMEVLLKQLSRKDAAEELGLPYTTYVSRLERRRDRLIKYLLRSGYDLGGQHW